MVWKSIGLILCAGVIASGSWIVGENYKKSAGDLEFLLELTAHIKREIYFSRTELPDCFFSFQNKKYSSVIDDMANSRYEKALEQLHLDKEKQQKTKNFLGSLGNSTTDEELQNIEKFHTYLQEEVSKNQKVLASKVKSARVLGICLAAALLLLFL